MIDDFDVELKKLIINILEYSSDVSYYGIVGIPEANVIKFKLKKYKKLNVEMYILAKIIKGDVENLDEIIDFARLCSGMDNIVDALIFIIGELKISVGEMDEDGYINYRYGNTCNIRIITQKKLSCTIGEYILEMMKIGKTENLDIVDAIISSRENEIADNGIPVIVSSVKNSENNRKFIKILITRSEIISKINEDIVNIRLIYSPYYFFNFKLDMVESGKLNVIKKSGIIAISLNDFSRKTIIKKSVETVDERELDKKILNYEIEESEDADMDEIKRILYDFLVKEFSGEREEKKEYDYATVIKTVHSTVMEDSVNIDYVDKYYWPFWIIETNSETLKVDASGLMD